MSIMEAVKSGSMQMLKAAIVVVAATATSGSAIAEGTVWYFAGGSDTINGGITTPSKWKDANENTATAFSVDDYYIVRSGSRLRISNKSFAGGKIQFGDLSASSKKGGIVHDNASTTVSFPNGAYFDCGYYWVNITSSEDQRDATLAGDVVVRSPVETPFVFYAPRANRALYVTAKLSSEAPPVGEGLEADDVGIVFGSSSGYNCESNFTAYLIGDCSGYKGLISVTSPHPAVYGSRETRLGIGDTTVGGKVLVSAGAAISAVKGVNNTYRYYPSAGTVSELELDDMSMLEVHYDSETDKFGVLNVSKGFETKGSVCVYVDVEKVTSPTSVRKVPVLTAPAGQIDADAFDLSLANVPNETSVDYTKLPVRAHLEVEMGSARDILYLVLEPFAKLTTSSTNSRDNTGDPSAFTNATYWSNSDSWEDVSTMAPDFNYWSAEYIRSTADGIDYAFPGRSFTLARSTFVIGGNRRLSFERFYWVHGAMRVMNGHSPVLCGGNVFAYSGDDHIIRCYNNSLFTIESEIVGDAEIKVSDESGTDYSRGKVAFTGLNTNFTGKISMTREFYIPGSFERQYMNLYVYDGRNLGGALPEFTYDALKLKYHASLVAQNDISLDGSLNRGIFIDHAAGISVDEGDVVRQGWTMTMNGLLRKSGKGTLEMGSEVKYLDADGAISDMPRAGSNLFNVAAGAVKITRHDAIDGLETSFASGTSLVLPLNPSDEDLVKYGILNAKTETPFKIAANMDRLPLMVDISACPSEMKLPQTFGLLTVKNTPSTVAAVKSMLPAIRPFTDVHHRIEERVNKEEGTVTFSLVAEHVGSRIVIR